MNGRLRGEDGNALLEFSYLAVLLMVPLFYLILAVFQVQGAAFAVTEASRQAGRAFVRAESVSQGYSRAQESVRLALADQGVPSTARPVIGCEPSPCDLSPGQRVETTVTCTVELPWVGGLFGAGHGGLRVSARHVEFVDRFTEPPP